MPYVANVGQVLTLAASYEGHLYQFGIESKPTWLMLLFIASVGQMLGKVLY